MPLKMDGEQNMRKAYAIRLSVYISSLVELNPKISPSRAGTRWVNLTKFRVRWESFEDSLGIL